jgi:hypothetical protein
LVTVTSARWSDGSGSFVETIHVGSIIVSRRPEVTIGTLATNGAIVKITGESGGESILKAQDLTF